MKKLTRQERKLKKQREKRSFRQAMNKELREHRSSFFVFYILRFLVLVVLVRQAFMRNYESMFFCILTILLLYVPSWVRVKLRIELPPVLESIILCFIFAAEILGELGSFYVRVPHWDTMLHTANGFLAAAIGFSLVDLLNRSKKAAPGEYRQGRHLPLTGKGQIYRVRTRWRMTAISARVREPWGLSLPEVSPWMTPAWTRAATELWA